MKALIVDDDKAMVKLLSACVEYCGHEAIGAADGEQARQLYELLRPDVVLMDIIMPVLDGVAAARQILDMDPAADIVFVTGLGELPDDIPDDLRRKVPVVTKPVTIHAILDLLETRVERRESATSV